MIETANETNKKSYFEQADEVPAEKLVNIYVGKVANLEQENAVLSVQLQQHIDREKKLLEILKKQQPAIAKTLESEVSKYGRNHETPAPSA